MTDAQVEAACATLRRAIEAAENANQAGEDFVMAAAAGPALLEALEAMQEAWFDYHDRHHLTQPVTGRAGNAMDLAIAALSRAKGEQP